MKRFARQASAGLRIFANTAVLPNWCVALVGATVS